MTEDLLGRARRRDRRASTPHGCSTGAGSAAVDARCASAAAAARARRRIPGTPAFELGPTGGQPRRGLAMSSRWTPPRSPARPRRAAAPDERPGASRTIAALVVRGRVGAAVTAYLLTRPLDAAATLLCWTGGCETVQSSELRRAARDPRRGPRPRPRFLAIGASLLVRSRGSRAAVAASLALGRRPLQRLPPGRPGGRRSARSATGASSTTRHRDRCWRALAPA